MKNQILPLQINNILAYSLILLAFIGFQNSIYSSNKIVNDTIGFNEYKGIVIDSKSKKALIFAAITVNNTNISSVTNTQGKFILKIPKKYTNNKITVSFLGYTSKVVNLSDTSTDDIEVRLETHIEELSEIKINIKDAKTLISEMLRKKGDNYFDFPTSMTAFYRETIKKRRSYVSLSEAVVGINKQSYNLDRKDILKLYRARKSTDYKKLDTITLKLRGGPYSTVQIDAMKNSDVLFSEDVFDYYDFVFENSTKIDNKPIFVVSFKQKPSISDPMYYGKLYIDANSYALTMAKFSLNLENPKKASRLFIIKKPARATVLPIEASYQIDYREKDGKWYLGYSRIQLGFKIDYDKRLFNSVYNITMEMAVTDWEKSTDENIFKARERLRSTAILSDEAQGFSDPEFWGEFNVIEPEKPIESAIKKIQKQLRKIK
ncbi:carboxypeptidase-like regulatory domain-containing protein [Lutibacter flavus]|uniref:CarboxypepD_reg-like domain-containing protein n=1 Tax=Lutibacter flavus TaxID=691689 RepID=A0A238ZH02_9FLAO|nr:carboxypeptidase-like regulatory domain-containing protein [Lutibacter flavus]SNR82301.1 CarboxypepD_reg-like domain-containing protein [Lutibacter flavus]